MTCLYFTCEIQISFYPLFLAGMHMVIHIQQEGTEEPIVLEILY